MLIIAMILVLSVASAYAERAITITLEPALLTGTDSSCQSFHEKIDNLFTKYDVININNIGWIPFTKSRFTKSEWQDFTDIEDALATMRAENTEGDE
jgi:hypothetical protein